MLVSSAFRRDTNDTDNVTLHGPQPLSWMVGPALSEFSSVPLRHSCPGTPADFPFEIYRQRILDPHLVFLVLPPLVG